MFAALTLAAGLTAAPVPKDAPPAGPPPRVVDLTPDPDGRVRVVVTRTENRKVTQAIAVRQPNGQAVIEQRQVEVPVTQSVHVELADVKDLTIYTADGREADKARALKQLADGGVVVVSADGKKVDPRYLRLFKDDVFVLTSPELAAATPPVVNRPAPVAGILPPARPLPPPLVAAPAKE